MSRATPLQERTNALSDLIHDARDELDADAYSWFVAVCTAMIGAEAARLLLGEAIRTQRDDEPGRAA